MSWKKVGEETTFAGTTGSKNYMFNCQEITLQVNQHSNWLHVFLPLLIRILGGKLKILLILIYLFKKIDMILTTYFNRLSYEDTIKTFIRKQTTRAIPNIGIKS